MSGRGGNESSGQTRPPRRHFAKGIPDMRHLALAAISLGLAGFAHAETTEDGGDVTFSGSLTFASQYVSSGIAYSDGLAVQPYLELGLGGFYAGVWASNGDADLLGADSEIDLYIGYRGEAGVFYYDVGYGYYTYPGASEFNTGEVLLSGGAGLNDSLYVTAYMSYSNDFDTFDTSVLLDWYTPVEGLALAALAGDNESWRYWSVGGSYALSESFSIELEWQDTDLDDVDGLVVGGLTLTF
jgi:uncharacterized protein (TIGR02001 family)